MKENIPPTVAFGRFLIAHRRKIEKKASTVALEVGLAPSNYSKIETGVSRPPQERTKLMKLGMAIGLKVREDWDMFHDLAAAAVESVPVDLAIFLGEEKLAPLLLRTIRDKNLSPTEIKAIIEKIRK